MIRRLRESQALRQIEVTLSGTLVTFSNSPKK
jgi:hypothetical protein